MQAYEDLQEGRFLVIADFEDPKHMELFKPTGTSDEANCVLDRQRGRPETGTGCLLFTAGSSEDAVVVNNINAANWYLKRDWRPFDLLLMSINAPRPGLALEITVVGGPPDERLAAGTTVPLQEGWTVARIDLAQVGERVPLDDVREMRFTVAGSSEPVQLVFDDILLTRYRRVLFGDPSTPETGLYVQQVGRRWKIGAGRLGGDFELTFADGRIVEWYNLATDPHRLRNLVKGTALGPAPTVVGSADANERDFMPFGRAVAAYSRIVEMSAVRAVVACEWRFVDDAEAAYGALDHRPLQRWVYTIYPTGQIYVAVEATVATPSWSVPQLGLAVAVASIPGDEIKVHIPARLKEAEDKGTPVYATARGSASDAFLLYVAHEAPGVVDMTTAKAGSADGGGGVEHLSLVAVADRPEGNLETWACHVFLGSSSKIPADEAFARALDYVRPVQPDLERGSIAAVRGGHAGGYGFDPADGCFCIAPDRGGVRFTIDGSKQAYFSPRFKIVGTEGQTAWVYVDDLILKRVAHDAHGNLIFQLPGAIRKPTVVEVLFRR